jgi:RNA polymerase sigma-70 factor (ECF subfamily)
MIEGYSLVLPRTPGAAAHETLAAPESLAGATAQLDLATLVATYSTLLFRVAHSILRNAAEAEDVVQDTYLRVLQHQQQLPSIRDLRPWLVRIAWNLALDRRRRIRPDQIDPAFASSLVAANLPADQAIAETQRIDLVLRELERLPKDERQAILLSALEELSTTEIAHILSRAESAIRALLHRARTRLRTRIEKGVKS